MSVETLGFFVPLVPLVAIVTDAKPRREMEKGTLPMRLSLLFFCFTLKQG
jgi:hypothetical protein